jgi:release factor glutamine methyltransferase
MTGLATAGTIGAALDGTAARLAAAGCVSADAEARWLLEEVLELPAGAAPARRATPLPPAAAHALEAMVSRREAGEPLQYVIGWAPFGTLRIQVGPGVFVPRPETELVAYRAASHLRAAARVLATEVDDRALDWARRNLSDRGVELFEGDLDSPLPRELRSRVNVLVTNVPYVPSGAIPFLPHDVRVHEPRVALDGGPDGLDVLRRVVARAGYWLAPGGWLVCEIGDDQGGATAELLAEAGFAEVAIHPDLTGRNRMAEGRRPG